MHFLELLKANLLKNGNNHKNSAKVDTFIFVWETMVEVRENNKRGAFPVELVVSGSLLSADSEEHLDCLQC